MIKFTVSHLKSHQQVVGTDQYCRNTASTCLTLWPPPFSPYKSARGKAFENDLRKHVAAHQALVGPGTALGREEMQVCGGRTVPWC